LYRICYFLHNSEVFLEKFAQEPCILISCSLSLLYWALLYLAGRDVQTKQEIVPWDSWHENILYLFYTVSIQRFHFLARYLKQLGKVEVLYFLMHRFLGMPKEPCQISFNSPKRTTYPDNWHIKTLSLNCMTVSL
jgi:hypothetical protein